MNARNAVNAMKERRRRRTLLRPKTQRRRIGMDTQPIIEHLAQLRRLALAKYEADPLPTGEAARRALDEEIEAQGLKAAVADLETRGYAVLPPGKAKPVAFFDELRETLLQLAQDDTSRNLGAESGLGNTLFHLLPRARIVEEAVLAPAPLALVTYLLGHRAKLSQSTGLIKDASAKPLALHADHSGKIPAPWPSVAQYCNVTWVTTDYTRENGAVCVWPGRHRFCRPVPADLVMAHDREEVDVLEVPKGSVIVWHGSLWHGAVPRTTGGQRVTLVLPHVRDHVQAQEMYWATTTAEMVERNPTRFCALMGLYSAYPWLQDGPPPTLALSARSGNQFE